MWPWATAAAALAAIAIGAHVWTGRMLDAALPDSLEPAEGAIHMLTDMLGGNGEARRTAERIIATEQMRAGRDASNSDAAATSVPR